jgi:hypothetical protein
LWTLYYILFDVKNKTKWLSPLLIMKKVKCENTRYKIQDILITNHGASKELNNHNIYNIHTK